MSGLHPDWPDMPGPGATVDPYADFSYALQVAGRGHLADIASVEAFDIRSDSGQWLNADSEPIATELSMSILGRTKDGRWFGLEAWNDYTGWGCQDGADLTVHESRDFVIRNGLTKEARRLLGVALPEDDQ